MRTIKLATMIARCMLLAAMPAASMAQEVFVPPPAKHIATIPFQLLTGGIMVLHATLDSLKDTLNFVLDTGSGGISLDSQTVADHQLKAQMSERIIRGIAGMRTVAFTYDHALHFQGLDVKKLDFHINDYDVLTSVYGIKIDGVIGYSFLRRYIVSVNYDEMRIDVFSPGTFKYPKDGHLLSPQFSTLPMQAAQVKDDRAVDDRFYFDTGAGLCMLLSEEFVQDSALLKKKRKKIFETQAEGLGGKKNMRLTVIKQVKVGPYKFRNVPVYIFDDDYGVTSYPVLGGLLGNDLLRRFNVVINYPDQQIFIKPNRHFTDSFDYSYTGLEFSLVNGSIVVDEVVKNSPADKAGFKIDDVIMAVGNDFSHNIQTYKILLQSVQARVKVMVFRNHVPMELTIQVRSVF